MSGDKRRGHLWPRARFVASWSVALALVAVALPRTVDVSWDGVLPVLQSVHWPATLELAGLWLLGLYVHSFVLTAAAPRLTRRRALTLNMTGSAIANAVPLGGAAGVELNRRMMKAWGIDTRSFAGYTLLTNVWDIGSKLLLPLVGVLLLARAGEVVTPQLRLASLVAGPAFLGLLAVAAGVLLSPRFTDLVASTTERTIRSGLRMAGRDRELHLAAGLQALRRECGDLVARGWFRMTAGITGYVVLQWLLLTLCLHLTGAGVTWREALAGFAIERLLTVLPVTPGGAGVADLGLVAILLALGGDPAGVAAGAVLYRVFIFALEIPVGGGVLGAWLLSQRWTFRPAVARVRRSGGPRRIAHVTDVFLPRLGGIETHVDDLARHQRAAGHDAEVLTPAAVTAAAADPSWVHRLSVAHARRLIGEYDVVHVHVSVWSPFGIAVARAAMANGLPTLVTVHSMWAGAGGLLRLAAVATLRRWPAAWSAVSGAAAETFRRSLGRTEVDVLPNAIDTTHWRPPATTSSAPIEDGASRVTIVSVMRLTRRKRPLQLLRMFAEVRRLVPHRDLELVVVGDGPLRNRMERVVARHGLTGCVRITGRLTRSDVLDELLRSSIYVAPAPKESFGIAALEARCAGLPIIASRRSGVGEFVRDRIEGLLVVDDTEMIAAMADLVTDDSLRERISAHNRRVVPAHDWNDALERTDALYEKAAGIVAVPTPAADVVPVPLTARA